MTKRGWIVVVVTGLAMFGLTFLFFGCAAKQEKIVLIPGQKIEIKTFRKIYQIEAAPEKIQFDGDFRDFLEQFTVPDTTPLKTTPNKKKSKK